MKKERQAMTQRMRGVGMVEVLIALAIVGITVVALIRLQGVSITRPAIAAGMAEASALAAQVGTRCKEMTEETASGFEQLNWLDNTFKAQWNARQYQNPERQEIDVKVTWMDIHGKAREVSLQGHALCGPVESGKLALLDRHEANTTGVRHE